MASVLNINEDFCDYYYYESEYMGAWLYDQYSSDENFDCISRVFAPKVKVSEDPVTGSTHCLIAPYWSKILNKNILKCYQASERGGILQCEIIDDRVKISGNAILFAKSKLNIEE